MDAETIEVQLVLDEAVENIIVLEPPSAPVDDDWMTGEFDIT